MASERVERVRQGLKLWETAITDEDPAVARAAIDEMLDGYDEDAETDYSRTLPDFMPTKGRESMRAWTEGARGLLNDWTMEAGDIVETGDAVVMPVLMKGRGAASDLPLVAEFAYVFWFRGEKIRAVATYQTLAEALAAAEG